jgi:hypothetical protein
VQTAAQLPPSPKPAWSSSVAQGRRDFLDMPEWRRTDHERLAEIVVKFLREAGSCITPTMGLRQLDVIAGMLCDSIHDEQNGEVDSAVLYFLVADALFSDAGKAVAA